MGYRPGDLIFKSEPFTYIVSDKCRGKRCDYCLKGNVVPLKRCTQCRIFYFCNRVCQKSGWSLHKMECLHLKHLQFKIPNEFALLMARVILKLKHEEGWNAYEEVMSQKRTFSSLISHVNEIKANKQAMDMFSLAYATLRMYLGQDELPDVDQFLSIFGKLTVNAFGIYDEEVVAVGSGLYLGASILDHSCCPNAVTTFVGKSLLVRAVKEIPGDGVDQVSISYIDQIQQTNQRQAELSKQYFFTCSCNWCTNQLMEAPMSEVHVPGSETKVASLISSLKEALETEASDLDLHFEQCRRIIDENSDGLGPHHALHSQLQNLLFDAAISLRRWDDAASFGLQSLPTLRLYLGDYHPSIGVLMLKTGKLLLFLERLEQGMSILEQAKEILAVTHGTERAIFSTCLELILNASLPGRPLTWKT